MKKTDLRADQGDGPIAEIHLPNTSRLLEDAQICRPHHHARAPVPLLHLRLVTSLPRKFRFIAMHSVTSRAGLRKRTLSTKMASRTESVETGSRLSCREENADVF